LGGLGVLFLTRGFFGSLLILPFLFLFCFSLEGYHHFQIVSCSPHILDPFVLLPLFFSPFSHLLLVDIPLYLLNIIVFSPFAIFFSNQIPSSWVLWLRAPFSAVFFKHLRDCLLPPNSDTVALPIPPQPFPPTYFISTSVMVFLIFHPLSTSIFLSPLLYSFPPSLPVFPQCTPDPFRTAPPSV